MNNRFRPVWLSQCASLRQGVCLGSAGRGSHATAGIPDASFLSQTPPQRKQQPSGVPASTPVPGALGAPDALHSTCR